MVSRLREGCVSIDDNNTTMSWPKLPSTFGFGKTQKDLENFLNAKFSFETKDRRKRLGTSVHLAVISGNYQVLKNLMNYGLSIDEKDSEQETPLMLSIQQVLRLCFIEVFFLTCRVGVKVIKLWLY